MERQSYDALLWFMLITDKFYTKRWPLMFYVLATFESWTRLWYNDSMGWF
jgi:hypothetical protein